MEKTIQDYPAYTINERGEVTSFKGLKPRKLKPQPASQSKKGYLQIRLFNKEYPKGKLHYIHRLVYNHFIGNIAPKLHIDHRDGNPRNNNVTNLQMMSGRENTQKYNRKKQGGTLLRDKRDELIQDYETLGTFEKVAEKWGVSITAVNRVVRNRVHTVISNGKYSTRTYDESIKDRWSL